MLNTTQTNMRELPDLLSICHQEQLSAMLHGQPGIGKSEGVAQYAQTYTDGVLHDVRLTQIEATDLKGICMPDHESGVTRWLHPEFLPSDPNSRGVVFLDEIDRAEPRLQASAMSLLLERRVGEYRLPPNWAVFAAGNGIEYSDHTYEMDAAVSDRLIHFKMEPDAQSFIEWGTRTSRIHADVLAFIKTNEQYLAHGKQRRDSGKMIAPTPRGWERVSRILARSDVSHAQLAVLIPGIVGQEVAAEFFAVRERLTAGVSARDLLDSDPKNRLDKLPTTLEGLYRLAYSLPSVLAEAKEVIKAIAILNLLDKLEERYDNLPIQEVKVMAAEMVFVRADDLKATGLILDSPEYEEYHAKHQALRAGG